MSNVWNLCYVILSFIFLMYLAIPNASFPDSSKMSLQSREPADIESTYRRGYYNNETRFEVINYYQENFSKLHLFGIKISLPLIVLNYPPEESQYLIRDQTRSTYLQEVVQPFRQSLFINGFEPKKDNDIIIVDGKQYKQKIIVKLINSSITNRILIAISLEILFYLVMKLWFQVYLQLKSEICKKKLNYQ